MPSTNAPQRESHRPPVLRHCEPGRTLMFDLAAGSIVAAVDGRLRIVHRDAGLDGIEGLSSRLSLVLEEGRAWTAPRTGLVEIRSLDGGATVALTAAERTSWLARVPGRVLAGLRLGWRPVGAPRLRECAALPIVSNRPASRPPPEPGQERCN